MIRIMIADDHPVFRYGLRALLNAEPDMELVGEASTGQEAVALASSVQPDVVLMDLNMPGDENGVAATRHILTAGPHTGVLVVTMSEDDDSVFAAVRAGARGYLLKGEGAAETLRAIRAVANGEAIFSPAIARRLIRYFAAARQNRARAALPDTFTELTEREHEVLELIAQGYTNTAIAGRLVLRPKTVRNHVSNIFSKLRVTDRAHAIVRAREGGMGRREA